MTIILTMYIIIALYAFCMVVRNIKDWRVGAVFIILYLKFMGDMFIDISSMLVDFGMIK